MRLLRLFELLNSPAPLADVQRAVFGDDPAALVPKVEAYVRDARFRGFRTSLSRTPRLGTPTPLSDVQVHLLRQRLHVIDEAAAKQELLAAGRLAGAQPSGELAVAQAEATPSLVATLAQRFPDHARALATAADAEADVHAKHALAERAARLSPADAWVRWHAAEAALLDGKPDLALSHATAGLARAPWSAELMRALARAKLAQKDCAAARFAGEAAHALAGERPSPQTVAWKKEFDAAADGCVEPPAPR